MKQELAGILLCAWVFFRQVIAEPDEKEWCQAEGFECASNSDCCSEYCEKKSAELSICSQACGRAITSLRQPQNPDEEPTEYEEFPWTAEIYGSLLERCTGTLISHTAVVSAASCFIKTDVTNKKIYKQKPSSLLIEFGKLPEGFDEHKSTNNWTRIFEVNSIEFPLNFEASLNGFTDNLTADASEYHYTDEIAILTLKTEVNYEKYLRPVCVDIGPYSFEKRQIVTAASGKLGCRQRNIYEVWNATVPAREKCTKNLGSSLYGVNINSDHICITKDLVFEGKRISIQPSYCSYGEGLVFQDPITKTYYLRGVKIMNSPIKAIIGKKVSAHKAMVEKYLDDCKRVCRKACGTSSLNLFQPNGNRNVQEEFPWNAGIYEYNATSDTYNLICGGTLINRKVVISSAYCFEDLDDKWKWPVNTCLKQLSTLKVALGKEHRKFNLSDDVSAQFVDIESVEYPPEYRHKTANDIIFVTLKTAVEYTKSVQPVCVDFGPGNFETEQLTKGVIGKVSGWDIIAEPESSDLVKVESMRYGTFDECVEFGEQRYISKALICAGYKPKHLVSSSSTIGRRKKRIIQYTAPEDYYQLCKNYVGRGLVFESSKSKSYYLRGVGALNSYVCGDSEYYPFTTLSSQEDLLEKYVYNCNQGCRRNLCEPLISQKLHIICILPNGQSIRCDRPLPINTRAIFSCYSVSYMEIKKSEYNIINCVNGRWDRPLVDDFCVPAYAECGKPVSDTIQAVVLNGKMTKYGEFPWHAGIYEYDNKIRSYEQICSGTLISHKVVVSAAHCVTDEQDSRKTTIKNSYNLKVGLGKYHRTLGSPADALAQILDIQDIEVPQEYRSHIAQYAYDIAFITLQTQVEYTRAVRPICIDVGPDNFETEQLVKGAKGKVIGWGLTEGESPSETLILAEMPFVPREDCISKISNGLLSYVKPDKICAGDINSNVTVCKGDSGGGLVFEDSKTKKYYLRGIVSLGPVKCHGPDFSLFTKLSSFKDLLEKHLRS